MNSALLQSAARPILLVAILLAPATGRAEEPTSKPAMACRSARECLLRGNFEQAIALYDEQSKKDPVGAACGRGEVDRMVGDYTAGIERLMKVESRGKNSPAWHATLAALLTEVGRYDEAVDHNRRALEMDEENFRARRQLGQLYELLGRLGTARDTYQKFEDVMTGKALPDRAEDLTDLGYGFYRYSTLTRNPDLAQRTRHVLTEVYQEAFDFVDSLYWPARLAGAELLLQKHQQHEAKEDFERILKQNPHVADALVGMGSIALEDWDFDNAQKNIDAALKANPHHVPAYVLLATLHMTERKYQEAAKAAEEALKTNPHSIDALSLLAAARLRLDHEATCKAAQKHIERINPKPAELHYELGRWLAAGRQFVQAEEHLKKAMEFAPTWSEPATELGQVYMETGEEESARRTLEAAYALDAFNLHTLNVLTLLDKLDKFSRLETDHFIVKFDGATDAVVAPYLAQVLEAIYPDVCSDFDVKLDKKTIIEMFPDHMGFSVRVTGRPFIATVGACTGRVIAFTAPRGRPPFGRFNWASVLRHEFTHTVTLAVTENRIPHWMTEGLAVHEEPLPRRWATMEMLATALRSNALFNLQSIDWGFMRPRKANDRQLAYAQSEWMIEYITTRWGAKSLRELLQAFRDHKPQEAAFLSALKIDTESFIHDFRAWANEQVAKWGMPITPIEDADRLDDQIDELPEDSPKMAELWGKLAESRLAEGDGKKAESAARKALKHDPNEPRGLEVISTVFIARMLQASKESERNGFAEDAEPFVRKLLKARPDNPNGQKYLGFIEQSAGNADKAIEILTRYQKRFPDDPDSYRRLAGIALQSNMLDGALVQLEPLARMAEDESAVALQIGRIRLTKQEPANAARWFRRAIDIDPFDPDVHAALGDALLKSNDLPSAEREYEVVCKLQPDQGIGYDGLAAVYKALGQTEKSQEYAARAAALEKKP